jgi:hypothetical protein
MPEPDFFIKQGDTRSPYVRTLEDANLDPVNLAGAAVVYHMVSLGGAETVTGPATITDAANGQVTYSWQPNDTEVAGIYFAEWQVTFSGGAVETFPNGGHDLVLVSPELG